MTPSRCTHLVAAIFVAVFAGNSSGDEVSEKQKKAALEKLAKAEVKRAAAVEGEAVIAVGQLPEARLRAIAATLAKTAKLGRKALQFDDKEEPWKGKLTVIYLPERKDFAQYMRLVVGQRPETSWAISIRGDEPFVISGADLNARASNADIAAELSPLVASAMLQAKVGTTAKPPRWVERGLGNVVAWRAEGMSGKRFSAYKTKARAAVLGGGGRPAAPIADVWSGERPDGEWLAASLMDFLAFGPGAANFPKFLSALRPGENGEDPAITTAIEAAGWKKPAELEIAWRKWVTAGSPVKRQ